MATHILPTRTSISGRDRSATALGVVVLAAALTFAALTAPDGGADVQPTGQTPTQEDWRGNSGSILPLR